MRPPGPFKVIELSTVTDETLQDALNTGAAEGFQLDSMHFAMRESSKRPSMAFLVFTQSPAPAPRRAPRRARKTPAD